MLSLLMSSCKGDDGAIGPMGPVGPSGGYYKQGPLEAKANVWQDMGDYYWASFEVPDLDQKVFEEGSVKVYLQIGDTKYPLNLDFPVEENGVTYKEEYIYNYREGIINFELSYSDGIKRRPGDKLFYFVLQSLD